MRYKVFRILARGLSALGWNYKELISGYFRRHGMKVGSNCNILSDINSSEPYLISIGDNVTISNDVDFITHDASIGKVTNGITSDLFGPIEIGNNCFIGAHSIIMYGVSLPDNTIVAAGSVVTHSVSPATGGGTIIGGSPAKVIGDWNEFRKKAKGRELSIKSMEADQRKNAVLDDKWWIHR